MIKNRFNALMAWDERVSNSMRLRSEQLFLWHISAFFAHSGDPWYWLIGFGLVCWLGQAAWQKNALLMLIAMLFLGAFVLVLKYVFRRARPVGEWGGVYRHTDPHSFPSGHAARAAMLAIMGIILGPAWFGWSLVLYAPLVILSRVSMGVHYVSDVIVGSIVGALFGCVMLIMEPVFIKLLVYLFI